MSRKKISWGKLVILPAVMVFLFAFLSVLGEDLVHYQWVYQNPLQVTATVTRYEVDDSDDDPYYDVYVAYTAQGKEYKDIYYDSSYHLDELPSVNQTLTIAVSPLDPGVFLSNLYNSGYVFMGTLAIFSLVLGWFMKTVLLCLRGKKMDDLEPESQDIQKDLQLTAWASLPLWAALSFVAGCALSYSAYAVPLQEQGLFIAMAIAGAVLLFFLFTALRKNGFIQREEYTRKREILVRKYEDFSANHNTYYLIYQQGETKRKQRVSRKVFRRAEESSISYGFYLKGAKRPLVQYNEQWEIV